MKDINFFSVYAKRRDSALLKTTGILIIFLGILVVIGGTYLALNLYCRSIEHKAQDISDYLNSEEVAKTLAEVERYSNGSTVLDRYEGMIDEIEANLQATNYIGSPRLDAISAALPSDVMMSSISVAQNTAEIVFEVPDLTVSAQLVSALSALPFFESVAVESIDADSTMFAAMVNNQSTGGTGAGYLYEITVSAVLKGGDVG
jgi:hypothetical protein